MVHLRDKVILVTGASAGIGEQLARQAGRDGAKVVLLARRAERLLRVANEIEQAGGIALAITGDVTHPAALESAVKQTRAIFGRLDITIANAGFGVQGELTQLSVDDYRRQFETNVFGVLHTLYATLPALTESKGAIGVVGSAAGYLNAPGSSAYCMSKHAVRSLCACIRHELARQGVSVTHIAPGFIESDIRRVDNAGVFRPEVEDPIPAWLPMPAPRAARKILLAVAKRRDEAVITLHAKAIVQLERHVPALVSGVVGRGGRWLRRVVRPHSTLDN